jgi:Protein of unknown function (DUF3987)/CHC2 zinc finger
MTAFENRVARARRVRIELEIERRGIHLNGRGVDKCGPCPKCGGQDRFSINIKKQVWNCRGCDIGGDVIDLVKHIDGVDFKLAVETLTGEKPPLGSSKASPKNNDGDDHEPHEVVAAEHIYEDEKGDCLFAVERIEYQNADGTFVLTKDGKRKKSFRQKRPDHDWPASWFYDVNGARIVPYNLPKLIEAIDNEQNVVIVEGERKADLLSSWNFPATCCAGGAKKWMAEHSTYLRGADVVILPDADDAGRKHLSAVAASLKDVAARVRVLELPDLPAKGDIVDWASAGGTAKRLQELIANNAADYSGDRATDVDIPLTATAKSDWPELHPRALYGLAGEVVSTIGPHTESDPVAILLQLLVCFGNLVGHAPYYQVESTRHHTNLFTALVGETSRARKGTSEGRVRAIAKAIDPEWDETRVKGGLSSGEGFINEVRDEQKKWNVKEKQFEIVEPAITDKRLLVIESEFAGALTVMERHGNTLSQHIRRAWDGGTLAIMTKTSPIKATNPHISIIGHITETELRARMTRTDAANGFANRFLFGCVRRSKILPFGGEPIEAEILRLSEKFNEAVSFAKATGRVSMDDAAKDLWRRAYERLSADQPGLLGAITARAEAQTLRLAMIFALLDSTAVIAVPHLQAAIAVWEFCEASAAHIFGDSLGDDVADEILRALKQAGEAGLTRTAIRDLFGRNQSTGRVGAALVLLHTKGRVKAEVKITGGRPSECWVAIERAHHG